MEPQEDVVTGAEAVPSAEAAPSTAGAEATVQDGPIARSVVSAKGEE